MWNLFSIKNIVYKKILSYKIVNFITVQQMPGKVIKSGCRTDDIIVRIGGDEFVIILPKTDALETEKIIKRISDLLLSEK